MFQLAVYSDHTGFLPPKTTRKNHKKGLQKSPSKSPTNKRSVIQSQIYTLQKTHRRDLFDDDGEECFFCSIEEFCASFWMVFVALVVFIVTFTMMYSESDIDTDFGVPVRTTRSTHRHYSIEEDIRFHQSMSCESKENFVFLRHNRTASSTMTNILQQFGYKRKLGFAIPNIEGSDSCTRQFNMTSIERKRHKFNIICNSARYNRDQFLKLVSANANYFSMLKNPLVTDYEKAIFSDVPLNSTIETKCSNIVYTGYEMMYNFGFESSELQSDEEVKNAIKWIEKTFDLIMIEEYFDESLLLLKKLMCWSIDDIAYYTLTKTSYTAINQTNTMPVITKGILESPDYHLYTHFNETLWKKISSYGPSFNRDLRELHLTKVALRNTCQPRLEFFKQRREIHPLLMSKSTLLQKPSLYACLDAVRNNTDFTRILLEQPVLMPQDNGE